MYITDICMFAHFDASAYHQPGAVRQAMRKHDKYSLSMHAGKPVAPPRVYKVCKNK